MRIGLCIPTALAQTAVSAGFDYVELPASELATATDLSPYKDMLAEATNLFFPGGIRLFGSGPFDWKSYAERLIPRAAEVGIKIMVVGSGSQRTSSEGQGVLEAEAEFVDMIAGIQEIATPHGITVAPEALNRTETDVFNDAKKLAHDLGAKGLSYTWDIYHALIEWSEDHGGLVAITPELVAREVKLRPVHVHLGNYTRDVPELNDMPVGHCLDRVKALGFDGRVSLESPHATGENLGAVLAQLRVLLG